MRTRRRSARLAGVLLLTPLLGLPGPAPASLAAPAGDARTAAEDAPAASSYPASSVALAGAAGVAPATADGVEPAGGLETAKTTRPVAPGLDLTSFDRYDAEGWLRADALTADLSGGVTVDYVNSGAVTRDEPLRAAVDRSRAVAAVNGDFFDINNSGAAQGVGIRSGDLIQSPVAGHPNAAAISAEGLGRIIQVGFEGSATLPAGPVPLTQFNNMVQRDGIGVFTPLWGSYPRQRAVAGAARAVEVTVTGGRVAAVATAPGEGPIPAGTTVLLGREAGADALAALRPGDPVDVAWKPKPSDGGSLRAAVGRRQRAGPGRGAAEHRRPDPRAPHRGRLLRRRTQDDHADRGRSAGRQPRRHPDRDGPDDGRAGRVHRAEPRRRRLLDPARPGAGRGGAAGGEQPVGRHRTPRPQRPGRLRRRRAAAGSPGYWLETASDPTAAPGRRPDHAVAARTGSSPA